MSVYYSQMTLRDLKEVAKAHGIKDYKMMEKEEFGGLHGVTISAGNFGMSMNAIHYFEMFLDNPFQ